MNRHQTSFIRIASSPVAVALILVPGLLQLNGQQPVPGQAEMSLHAAESYGRLPLSFEANSGQANAQTRYLARGAGYVVSLTQSGAELAFYRSTIEGKETEPNRALPQGLLEKPNGSARLNAGAPREVSRVRLSLVGAETDVEVSGEAPLRGTVNYFAGDDPARWHTAIPTYGKVRYSNVYPGVDLVYYGTGQQLEFDFIVAPHADANRIRMHFDGAGRLALDPNGDLIIRNGGGDIHFHKPAIYQQSGEGRLSIDGGFQIGGDCAVQFQLGSYDRSKPLIIDPVLAYSTYVESGWVTGMAVDGQGEAVISGVAFGFMLVTPGAFETKDPITVEGDPVYVAKLNAQGTGLVFATFLQGKAAEDVLTWPYGVGVDSAGNVYVAGQSDLRDFPTTKGAFLTKSPGGGSMVTGFVSKLSADGTKLLYSTFLGGTKAAGSGGLDSMQGIAVDAAGHAYLSGISWSSNFPTTPGAYQRKMKPGNIRNTCTVSKLNLAGSGLDYATYLGGSQNDQCQAIAIDSEGNATVGGYTTSDDYPVTVGAIPRKVTGLEGDGMVSKLNADGTKLLYSTYLGGSSALDEVVHIADDPAGNVYVLGETDSTDFPTTAGAYQRHIEKGSIGSFIAKFAARDMNLEYATYLGEFEVIPYGIAADAAGNAYVTGDTGWGRFPVTKGAFLTVPYETADLGDNGGGEAAFLLELNQSGSALRYSTFLGGSLGARCGCARAVAIGNDGDVYLSGWTYSPDFPVTPDAFMATPPGEHVNGGGKGGESFAPYVMKINAEYMMSLPATTVAISSSANPQKSGSSVTFTAQVKSAQKAASVPTGLIGFDLWGVAWETVQLDSKGIAKFTVPASDLQFGEQHMIVMYLGDDTHAPSSAVMAEVIE